jgi:hypothetical protein
MTWQELTANRAGRAHAAIERKSMVPESLMPETRGGNSIKTLRGRSARLRGSSLPEKTR